MFWVTRDKRRFSISAVIIVLFFGKRLVDKVVSVFNSHVADNLAKIKVLNNWIKKSPFFEFSHQRINDNSL